MNVKTAGRTLDLFEAFARAGKPLSLSQLARAMDTPVSSCFGIVRTLEARGYLYEVKARAGFYPTKLLFEHARAIAGRDPLAERFVPRLEKLRDQTGETVLLAKRLERQAVYLEVLDSVHSIRYSPKVGEFRPLHASASGKALLGSLAPALRDELLRGVKLPRVTSRTITSRAALAADLAQAQARGWYVTRGETVADLMAVAVPIELNGETYSVALAGPMHRMETALKRHAKLLVELRAVLEEAAP
ncbi:MAG TPA: IclR family transcriptional regulator C-terminal domain-containing protein [Burkholderiales bacterium]|nr:IclR family transcriptional regulator C-terminal domain-containing protein [Burkholderiales bacterium]